MARSRVGALAGRALLALGSAVFAIALGECALRVAGREPARYYAMRTLENPEKTRAVDAYPSDPRGYFPLDLRDAATRRRLESLGVPGLERAARRAPHAVEFEYSADGCRGPIPGERVAGVRRVLLIGDSFTEGQGVREEDTFARRIERALRAEGERVEVINCGRRGRDFPALYDTFAARMAYRPDLVVYAMVLNDAAQSPEFHARQSFMNDWIQDRRRQTADDDPSPGSLGAGDLRVGALVRERLEARRVGRETTRWYRDMYGPPNAAGWRATQNFLARMRSESEAAGARFRVALLPLLTGLDAGYPFEGTHRAIADACRSLGISLHDVLPALAGRRPSDLWVHAVDMHPNERAHELIAASLLPIVRADLRAPPGGV